MIQYKNILYCTDYSEDAEIAFYHAVDLATRYSAKLHVFHALPSAHRYWPTELKNGLASEDFAHITPELLDEVAGTLKERYGPRLDGLSGVIFSVVSGTPFVEILRYARDHQIDLIVLGAAGTSELEPTHYGSTVDQVSRRAHCAVMAIRNPEKTYTL